MSFAKREILLIDTNVNDALALKKCLEARNTAVIISHDAGEALKLFVTRQPDIVFIAIDLAQMNGIETIRAILNDRPKTLVAAVANSKDQSDIIGCMEAGARAFLLKPLEDVDVTATLNRFIGLLHRQENKTLALEDLQSLSTSLSLQTSSSAIIPAISLICSVISPYLREREIKRIQLALHEILRNSYEHGNLGLSFTEKRDLMMQGLLEDHLKPLAEKAQAEGKTIDIVFSIAHGEFTCRVSDQGPGFDWSQASRNAEQNKVANLYELHGRGLILIKSVFDKVKFNKKGNQITVSKRLVEDQ
ncbi:MAG: ATP-binding protein [bacterium]|nr:ATP-binding protein [bacterium]